MLVLRVIVVAVGIFVLVLMGLVGGLLVDPFIEAVAASEAVSDLGLDRSLRTAMMIGMGMVLPLLGLASLVWLHTAELQHDIGQRRY